MKKLTLSVALLLISFEGFAQTGDILDVPDPTIIKYDGAYYIFSTAAGIPIRKSTDLVDWQVVDTVFNEMPSWVQSAVPGVKFPWAPDISFYNGLYHLYYSLSTFGSQHSVIALATNKTLDLDNPDYRWEDKGKVITSDPGVTDYNAIDPNLVIDERNQPWIVWGSFWGGIRMRKIDAATGLTDKSDTTLFKLASRPVEKAIEAPYIIRRNGFYYLFVSFDACCSGAESTYKVMVGRSRNVTGPYVDRSGKDMMSGGGTLVLESQGEVRGPGHNAILSDGGKDYIVHHYVNVKEGPALPDAPLAIPRSLQIRTLNWDAEGWPTAGAPIESDH